MATKRIKIPGSIEAAQDRLVALDGIATATGWERAAIVYAYTYEGSPGRRPAGNGSEVSRFTVRQFAGLKIKGLVSRNTIDHYRDCWKDAIAQGEVVDIEPGDSAVLPDRAFPSVRGTDGYNTPEGAEKTIERIKAKHGPGIIGKQAQDPKVAATIVDDKKSKKSVLQQEAARTQRIVKKRKAAAAAAGATVKGQITDAVDSSTAAMDNSSAYTAVTSNRGQMIAAWQNGIKDRSFNPLDRQHLGADLPSLRRLVEEVTAYVEAEDDPYDAVAQVRAEREDAFQREMDEDESGTVIDIDEINRFANEGTA